MKYESRAALLRAAADSIEMQEKEGVEPIQKYNGGEIEHLDGDCSGNLEHYEFPFAVVEGKPVFVGDELYVSKGEHDWTNIEVTYDDTVPSWIASGYTLSWNPPKPSTVMVELLREDAEWASQSQCAYHNARLAEACKKALEAL